MVSACLEITTTRDIARQILRHRSFSFQEFSQRYADPTQDLDFTVRETRLQDHANRQNSTELDVSNPEHRELADLWHEKQAAIIRQCREAYTWAVTNGIAKEQARALLPEGLTTSRMYMNGTMRSWIHYLKQRLHPSTQKEHRVLAQQVLCELNAVAPLTMNAFFGGD